MQDNAIIRTTNNSTNLLINGLQRARSSSLNPCDFYLWSTINDKLYVLIFIHYKNWKKIYGRKFQLFQDDNFTVCLETFFSRCESCREANGQQFETQLWTTVSHIVGRMGINNQFLLLIYAGSLHNTVQDPDSWYRCIQYHKNTHKEKIWIGSSTTAGLTVPN